MDIQGTPSDSTAIIRMRQTFDEFLAQPEGKPISDENEDNTTAMKLNFSDVSDVSFTSYTRSSPSKHCFSTTQSKNEKEAALLSAKCYIAELESKLSFLETKKKRIRVDCDAELAQARQDSERELDNSLELKNLCKFLMEHEEQIKKQMIETTQALEKKITMLEHKLQEVLRVKAELERKMQQSQETAKKNEYDYQCQILQYQEQVQNALSQLEEKEVQHQMQLRKSSDDYENRIEAHRLKLQTADHEVKKLEHKLEQLDDEAKLMQIMKQKLASFPTLEKENSNLKESNRCLREAHESVLILKEKVESLTSKCLRAEDRCKEYDKLLLENQGLKDKLMRWSEILKISCPEDMMRTLTEFQNTEAVLLEKQGALQASVHATEVKLQVCEDQLNTQLDKLQQEQKKFKQQTDLIKRLQKKVLLLTKERDGYKKIIDSYESEVTINVDPAFSNQLQEQERILHGYKAHAEQCEAELLKQISEFNDIFAKYQQVESELNRSSSAEIGVAVSQAECKLTLILREKIAQLETKVEQLSNQNGDLLSRIEQGHLQGEYDPTKVKVLHYSFNPVTIAQKERAEELAKLREENKKLAERVKMLEENGGHIEDLTVKVENKATSNENIHEIKKLLETAELKNQRLMEAFKKTSQEFRTIVYQLTGYQINIKPNNQYQLMSMYAESPNDYLLFQQADGGEMQLLVTDFSTTLTSHIQTFLQTQDSIPCFLSSCTLDLFSRQTVHFGGMKQ